MLLSPRRRAPMPIQSIQAMAGLLAELGIDSAPAFRAARLEPALLRNPMATVSVEAEFAFQEAFVALTRDQRHVWLELGLRSRFLFIGIFGMAVMTARTLGSALETAGRLTFLHQSLATYEMAEQDGVCTLRMNLAQAPEHMREFTALRDAPSITDLLNVIWGAPFPFLGIEMTARDSIATKVRKPEAMTVRRGEPGAFWTWPAELLQRRLPAADRRAHEAALRQAELLLQQAMENDGLRGRLTSLFDAEGPGLALAEAAEKLHMSQRTLQRRLQGVGVSYREAQGEARIAFAQRLLRETPLPVAEIAWRLGYTETSAFNHSFRKACGVSPRAWRKAQASVGEPA